MLGTSTRRQWFLHPPQLHQEAGCKTLEVKTRAHGIVRSERLNHDKPATDVIVSIEEEVAATITTESVQ